MIGPEAAGAPRRRRARAASRPPASPTGQLVGAGAREAPDHAGLPQYAAAHWSRTRSHVNASTSERAASHPQGAVRILEHDGQRLGHGGRILRRHDQPGLAVADQRGDVARRGRDDRQTRGEGLEHRQRLVVDDRGVHEDVGGLVDARHLGGLDAPHEADPVLAELGRSPQSRPLAPVSGDRQGRRRESVSHQRERFERGVDPVVGLEISRREEARVRRHPIAVAESRGVHDVRHDARRVAVSGEHRAQVLRRHDDLVRERQPRMDQGAPALEVILGFAAVVVEQDPLAEKPRRQERRRHREQERPVGCREHVHDVGVAQPAQARDVERLVQHGPDVRGSAGPSQARAETAG